MIHRFLITIVQTTLICQRSPPKHKIIQGKDPPINSCQKKKNATLLGILTFQTLNVQARPQAQLYRQDP